MQIRDRIFPPAAYRLLPTIRRLLPTHSRLPPTAYCLLYLLLTSSCCLAASVRTLDGQSYEGEVKLEQDGQVSILAGHGAKTVKVKLEDVLHARFGPASDDNKTSPIAKPGEKAAATLKPGILFKSGTLLAGAAVESADQTTLKYHHAGKRETAPWAAVARVIFREIGPELAGKIPPGRAGVLLRQGDFIEGDLRGIERGRMTLSSVLFGLKRFDPRDGAAALVLHPTDADPPRRILRARDGSVYQAKSITPRRDALLIEDVSGATFSIARWDVAEFSAGAARMQPLGELKALEVEPPTRAGRDSLVIDSTGIGLPMNLGGAAYEKGVTLAAGSAATWQLDGKYRTMALTCGVPRGVLPTAAVRFIVVADGKELWKSRPRAGLDDPLTMTLNLNRAGKLTLKVESTAGDALSTPGLFVEMGLVK